MEGRKTMTRRIIKCPRTFRGEWVAGFNIHRHHSDKKIVDWPCMYDADEREFDMGEILPKYELGEVVAIAQSTKRIISNVVLKLIYEFAKHSKPRLTGRLNVLIASSLLPNNRNKRIYSQIKTNRL